MSRVKFRKLGLTLNYNSETGELINCEWQWLNSRCTKNGTEKTLLMAKSAATIAYDKWKEEQDES